MTPLTRNEIWEGTWVFTVFSFGHPVCDGPLRPKGEYTIGYANLG